LVPFAFPLLSITLLVRPEQQHMLIIQKMAAANANAVQNHVVEMKFFPTVAWTPKAWTSLL
jgi:hypothetical protein